MPNYGPLLEQRATALATVLLTRHPDLLVRRESMDTGFDLVCEILEDGRPVGMQFVAELKARTTRQRLGRSLDSDSIRIAAELRNRLTASRARNARLPFPMLYILFEMQHDEAFFGWIREPIAGTPSQLADGSTDVATRWGQETHIQVVAKIRDWYGKRESTAAQQHNED